MNIERNFKQPTVWSKHEASNGEIWYVPVDIENKGDHVHVSTRNKDGYAGSSLKFKLEDNSVDVVKGPWHSNTEALFRATGIDLRDTHYSKFMIYSDRNDSNSVVYETDWELGKFGKLPDEGTIKNFKGKRLLYTSYSVGGSTSGGVDIHL